MGGMNSEALPQLVVLDGHTLNPGDLSWVAFDELARFTVHDRTPAERTVERIGETTLVLTNKTVIDQQVIAACPALRYIGVLATGYNVVDIDAAKAANITVTNVPAYGNDSVAQMVFAHLLHLCRNVALHADDVKQGGWSKCDDFCYTLSPQVELTDLTLGLIGFGRIGQQVAQIGRAMGMKITYHTRTRRDVTDAEWVELDDLLKRSDVISLHCPLTDATHHLINAQTLGLMRRSAMLINTGRGPLVDEQALADALNDGQIAGAGLDVLSSEPPEVDNPLLSARNCYITPHIAWATQAARQRLMNIAADNLRGYLAGEAVNVVS